MKITRRPEWLQKKVNPSAHADMERMLGELSLHTVCQEAMCPNISECFRQKQATFLILGSLCTRRCSFCNVTKQEPLPPDLHEPERVAEAVKRLGLSHVVVTSPTRDDLGDGGASHFAATVEEIRRLSPETKVELLVPDFMGKEESIDLIVRAKPDIFGHNVETVPRLYEIRAGADYGRSLSVLSMARRIDESLATKSGIMLGLGEREPEVLEVLRDLRNVECDLVSIGQYLAPSRKHHEVREFIEPIRFEFYRKRAIEMGFRHVESGPYVRSSYHAANYIAGTGSDVR